VRVRVRPAIELDADAWLALVLHLELLEALHALGVLQVAHHLDELANRRLVGEGGPRLIPPHVGLELGLGDDVLRDDAVGIHEHEVHVMPARRV